MVNSGIALAGILIVATVSRGVMLDGLSWVMEKSTGYLGGAGGDPFA